MTLDEAIAHAREVAEEQRKACDLAWVWDNPYNIKKCAEEHEQLAEWLEELKKYREIGTPEECRAAVEKQKTKKMVIKNDNGRPRRACVGCGCFVLPASRFCSKCGQKLDWSDEE